MSLSDYLIIYLACGAPFGVYYFLQHRKRSFSRQFWLKAVLNFLFWIFFAVRLLLSSGARRDFFGPGARQSPRASFEARIAGLRQEIENVFLASGNRTSLFEMREILERYVGLSSAARAGEHFASAATAGGEKEIFRAAKRENVKLAAACLRRRNLGRLSFHQIRAGEDFTALIGRLSRSPADLKKVCAPALELARALQDAPTRAAVERILESVLQTVEGAPVRHVEKELWKPELQKLPAVEQVSLPLPALRASLNSSSKD